MKAKSITYLAPYANIEMISPYSIEKALEIINSKTTYDPSLGMTSNKKSYQDYEGKITRNSFKIRRILKSGYSSFTPIIHGEIVEHNNGTLLKLKLKLHPTVKILIVAFTVFSGSLFLINSGFHSFSFFVLPFLMSTVFFNIEAKMFKQSFRVLLKIESKN